MKSRSTARTPWFCFAICLALAPGACGKSGGNKDGGDEGGSIPFDGEKAPYGPKTTTTRVQSVLTITSGLLPATSRSQDTVKVGQKAIGTVMYDRLATVRSDDPSEGGEYWIKENANETLDFAGFMHTNLLSGVLPSASTTFTTPIKVNLNPPIGQAQPVTATGTVALGGSSGPSNANFSGQYMLTEKEATVTTGIGPVSGCNHFTGSATTDSAEVPAVLQGMTISAELWYHPSYGVVAFNAPTLGLGTTMTGSDDCGSIDASNYRIIRKVGVVDSTTPFNLDSFSCDGNQIAADKNTHAKMLLELRWVDETAAKTDVQPMPVVEFGTAWGYFPNAMNETPASVFHPEESGKGFKYWYSYVDQAAKNEPGTSTSYHIKVTGIAGLSPVRVTARIYYKVIPLMVGPGPDAAVLGGTDANAVGGNRDGGSDQIAGGSKDIVGGASDVAADVVGAGMEGGTDAIGAATTCNLIVNGNAEAALGSTDGTPVSTPGWTSTGEATAGQYGAPYGYPGPTDPGPTDRGNNLFAGGVADEISTLTQTVNVSQYASAIDTSGVSYLLSGWLGGWDGQDDNAVLTVTFQSASGSALGTGTIGPVLSSDRSGTSGLFFRSTSGAMPSGTRTALVVLTLTRTSGTNNDSYADNLSLALGGAGIPSGGCSPGPVLDGGSAGGKDAPVATGGTIADGGRDLPLGAGGMGGAGGSGGITGTGGGVLTVPTGSPTIIEDFDTLPDATTQFVPIQAAGGDFAKFATVSGGRLVMDVPAGNSWGKTGVRSKDPIFEVTADMATSPWSVLVELDPAASTGFVVALSPAAADDIWAYGNFWLAWIRHPIAGGTSANIVNTQNTTDTTKVLTNTPLTSPGTVAVVARPGQVQGCTSSGWGMEGNYAWMTAGTKVYAYAFSHAYDSGMPVKLAIKSIKVIRGAACGDAGSIPTYTPLPEKAVFADDLSAGTATYWTPIQAAGGDFAKFATTPAGDLYVDVPAGNSWGKTGLRSSFFMFDVRDDMQTTPLSLAFDFVPSRTGGFALALSSTAGDDVWASGNFWGAFVRHPTGAGATANITNTQNASDSSKSLPNIPSDAPSTVTLSVRPGHVQMCTSTGWGMEGDYAWLTAGTKVYAYAFSHAYDSGMPVQMDLTNVRADRTAACGASGAIPAYPAPAPRILFQDSFAGGYAQNWVGIQAAGGDFSKFAVTTTNEVYVNVPASNSWGKTGIRSNYYLFDVRSDYATAPMTLDFALDATRTSGFVLALSAAAADDVWANGNVWMAFIIDPDTGLAEFDLTNTQNTTDTTLSKTALSAAMPSKVSLTITPKHVKATLSNGQVLEGDYSWLDVGTKVYAYAFSHPIRANLPSSMALRSVTATR